MCSSDLHRNARHPVGAALELLRQQVQPHQHRRAPSRVQRLPRPDRAQILSRRVNQLVRGERVVPTARGRHAIPSCAFLHAARAGVAAGRGRRSTRDSGGEPGREAADGGEVLSLT